MGLATTFHLFTYQGTLDLHFTRPAPATLTQGSSKVNRLGSAAGFSLDFLVWFSLFGNVAVIFFLARCGDGTWDYCIRAPLPSPPPRRGLYRLKKIWSAWKFMDILTEIVLKTYNEGGCCLLAAGHMNSRKFSKSAFGAVKFVCQSVVLPKFSQKRTKVAQKSI
jgi:hypothetical protein